MLLLSNTTLSFTLYPSPDFKISKESIEPWLTDVTLVVCDNISFDSIMKSLFANESDNLYGNVFLTNFESLKLNDWSIVKRGSKTSGVDLYVFPMK